MILANSQRASVATTDKATHILHVARELFRRNGYGQTSMDSIALAAKVSKATLYVYFSDKRDLFANIILQERDRYGASFLTGESGREDIRIKLLRFGRNIVDFLVSAETVASVRMVVAEADRLPELAEAFYLNGPTRFLDHLESFIERSMKSGALRNADPRRAAEHLIGLVRGDLQLSALLGVEKNLTQARIDEVIRSGVDAFYGLYGPEKPQTARTE
jgi:AcrR family transcriptional regulator